MIPCRQCKSERLEVIEDNAPPYRVLLCKVCDYAFVWPVPDLSELKANYEDTAYYDAWVGPQAAARCKMWQRRAQRVLGDLKPGRVLDVGAGEGSFLHAAAQIGWSVSGVELSADGVALAKKQWGLDVYCGSLEDAHLPAQTFDVITLWHVIEHVPDPAALLKEVFRLCKPRGRVVIACPNRRGYFFRWAYRIGRGRRQQLFHPEDREHHISHFSPHSLTHLVAAQGFRVDKVRVDSGHVQRVIYAIDLFALVWSKLTGVVWSGAMELWAYKPE